ncbi:MAG: response regulator transcription factor [Ramlibacter sp.]|nr:response regulator transcription factor [Ramlibacter sp.]
MHVGLLEDDADQRELAQVWLEHASHSVTGFATVAAMLEGLKTERFEAMVLDWNLPDGTGADVLQWVRHNLGWEVAVIMLTARDEEALVVQALQSGADDYVVKPAKQQEFLARLASAARRAKPGGVQVLRLGVYEVDLQRQVLSMDNVPVPLTQKEFDLAAYLLQSPGKLLSRDHLLNKIWGLNTDVDTRTVDTHVSRLRKKLHFDGSSGWKLLPVYGYGYRLDRITQT